MQGQTGSYVLTTLVTPPASAALTTLANVKDELGITEGNQDNRLNRFINEESAHIARYCNRIFGLAIWSDAFRPQRGVWGEGTRSPANPLTLTKWPLVASGPNPAATFTANTYSNTQVDGIASTAGLVKGQAVFGPGITPGTTITALLPNGLFLSLPATATASAVVLSAGIGVLETVGGTATWLVVGTDFEIDQGSMLPGDEGRAGLYRLNQQGNPRIWPHGLINVWYQAGYSLPDDSPQSVPMPSDLESAALLAVVRRYQSRGRDPLLVEQTQPNLGAQRWWVGGLPGQRGSLAPEIAGMLANYRPPVIA